MTKSKRRRDRDAAPELVAKAGIARERGWLYFVDPDGDIARVRARWAGPRRWEKVVLLGIP
jgi:hypothetical protein